jgi:hypothetical protein
MYIRAAAEVVPEAITEILDRGALVRQVKALMVVDKMRMLRNLVAVVVALEGRV